MNWCQELMNLYDSNRDKVGVIDYRRSMPYTLLPLFHTTATAQIEITIDGEGTFWRANTVDESDKFTIIPATEKSASRTAGKEPHPLCDNLKYIAGDYMEYCEDDGECYRLYIQQLKNWSTSDYSHKKVQAIYKYLKKRTVIKDLLGAKALKLDENGVLSEKEKIQNISQTKAFVRFIVRTGDENLVTQYIPDECWKDRTLHECYIQYVKSLEDNKGLCYLSGNIESISYLHSKKIRNDGDGAKLISANDSENFTYRGRFAEKEEAFAVGSETSQKIHNALKWIIRKQGKAYDTFTVVTWESNNLLMPSWDLDTDSIISNYEKERDEWGAEEEELVSDGNEIIATSFYQALEGYRKKVQNTSAMVLLGVDAATTGRLSLVETKKLDTARYLKNIQKWHESCEWIHEKWKDGKRKEFTGMVGVKDIADILFGIESKGILIIVDKNSKKMYAKVVQSLIPCIWDGQQIPYDYVNRAVLKASNPMSYKEESSWKRVLTLACSMIKRQRKERYKEEWTVKLDTKCTNRNYLYGRLLAVADRIEYRTYDMEEDGAKVTNARRYMNTFSQRPYETWTVIEESIQPYLNKLKPKERVYYANLIDEIDHLFEIADYVNNTRLEGLYLLGFHSQSYELKYGKLEKSEQKETEES